MTEIPEHLLKRSRERRQALGLPTRGRRGGCRVLRRLVRPTAPATTTPAAAPASGRPRHPAGTGRAATAQAGPALRAGRASAAARSRSGPCPCWRSCRCGRSCTPRPCGRRRSKLTGALAVGAEVFGQCASCHGDRGPGRRRLPVRQRRGAQTFPELEEQVAFVTSGSQVYDGQVYGDPNRPGGPHIGLARATGAPCRPSARSSRRPRCSAVVCHERYTPGRRRPDRRRVPRVLRS